MTQRDVTTVTSPRLAVVALIGCCVGQVLLSANGSIVNSALPAIQSEFGVDLTTLQWVVSAFFVTIAGLLTAVGSLADRVGRKRTMLLSFVVLATGSIIAALAGDVVVLIAGRVVQAVGAAGIATAGLAAVSAIYPDAKRRKAAVAWWAGVGTVALVAGPAMGGAVVALGGWRAVFWLSAVTCVVGAVIVAAAVTESRADSPAPFDAIGQVFVSTFLVAVAVVLLEGPREGWTSAVVLVATLVAVAALAATVARVRMAAHPIIPPSLFRSVRYLAVSVSSLLGYALAGAMFFSLPLYLHSRLDMTAGDSAIAMLPIAGSALVAAIVSGAIVDRGRTRVDLVAAGLLLAGGVVGILIAGDTLAGVIVASVVFGAGYGLIGDPLSVSSLAALPTEEAGLASALFATGKQFGQLLGIATVGIVLGSASNDIGARFVSEGPILWGLLAGFGVMIALVNLAVGHRGRPAPTR